VFPPPATSTLPDCGNTVAVIQSRATPDAKFPAEAHVFVAGSYTAVEARRPVAFSPPATSTLPLLNTVAVCTCRASGIEATAVQVPVPSSYTVAEDTYPLALYPPTTNTLPEGSTTPAWYLRASAIPPVPSQPTVTSGEAALTTSVFSSGALLLHPTDTQTQHASSALLARIARITAPLFGIEAVAAPSGLLCGQGALFHLQYTMFFFVANGFVNAHQGSRENPGS
jgi:hypothetical protein